MLNVRPLEDTDEFQATLSFIQIKPRRKKMMSDPAKVIPDPIFKVVRSENRRNLVAMGLTMAIVAYALVINLVFWFALNLNWPSFILPTTFAVIALLFFWHFLTEFRWINKALKNYRSDLRDNLKSTPPFLVRIYRNLVTKQVSHNWLTFFILFYGGIFTLLLWALKDASWWIFEFNVWIKALFFNPNLMLYIFVSALALVVILHVAFFILRKRKILEIDSFFGSKIVSEAELDNLKKTRSKMFFRMFILSVLIIVVIPIITIMILKITRKKVKK